MPVETKATTRKRLVSSPSGARNSTIESTAVPSDAPGLEIRLFGPMEVRINGGPLPHLRSRKGLWLLALLALRGGRDVDRDWLAGTLWSENDEPHGRRSLRQSLHDLRSALGAESWRLHSEEPRTMRLDMAGATVDVAEFDASIARGDQSSLEAAARLYRGPLLEDCAEDWALEGRRQREHAYVATLEKLASAAAGSGEHGLAAGHLRAALSVDPYREDLLRALMEGLAADGSIAAALLSYRQYRALLGRELAGEPAEETAALFLRLKTETRVTERPKPEAPQKSEQRTAKITLEARRTLPIPLTELIGREREVREVVALSTKTRLITLTGTGGVGKTRLAIRIAEELSAGFSEGVAFVDLAPLENPALLPDAVRTAFGAPAEDAQTDPMEVLCRAISGRQMLLVLDNCEHLGGACGNLAEALLGRCPGLKILTTSRQTLGVVGETVWRVPSLAVPKTGSRKTISAAEIRRVAELQDYASIRLFSERARAAESSFEHTPKDSVSMVMICSLLDGIPLAIELAAAWVKAMPVEKIAQRLNDRFRILLGSDKTPKLGSVPRHQTLRASIDWSYDLLSSYEQLLLRHLSVSQEAGPWRQRKRYARANRCANGKCWTC